MSAQSKFKYFLSKQEDPMKKRIYRATKVKKINLKKLQEEIKGRDPILAVDVANPISLIAL